MSSWNTVALLAIVIVLSNTAETQAQSTRDQIADALGTVVKVDEAALFAASFRTFRDFCGRPLENVGIVEGITRIEFGAITSVEQEVYKSMMIRQYQGNVDLWNALANKAAEGEYCRGLERAIIARTAQFMRLHSSLFAKKDTEKIAQQPTFMEAVTQKTLGLSKISKLYVFRVAENRMADDMRMLIQNPENDGDGYSWMMKVFALQFGFMAKMTEYEFEDVSKIYGERGEIYAKMANKYFLLVTVVNNKNFILTRGFDNSQGNDTRRRRK